MKHARFIVLVVVSAWLIGCVIGAVNYITVPDKVCPEDQREVVKCKSADGTENGNTLRVVGIYGNVPCTRLVINGFSDPSDPTKCGGGSTAIRVELEVSIAVAASEGCYASLPITYVSKNSDVPVCSFTQCTDTTNCIGLKSVLLFNVTMSGMIFERPITPVQYQTFPWDYMRLTRAKRAVGYKSSASDTEAVDKAFQCSNKCGSSNSDSCRWRNDGSNSHKSCSTAASFAEHYSYSRAGCVKKMPAAYWTDAGQTDNSGMCVDCNDNSKNCNTPSNYMPGISPLTLIEENIDQLGKEQVSLTMSDGVAPEDVDTEKTSVTYINTGGFYCPLNGANGDAEYYASLLATSATTSRDERGTWMFVPINLGDVVPEPSQNMNMRTLDCGYCGKNGQYYIDLNCKDKIALVARRQWILGISPFCRFYQPPTLDSVPLFDARLKLDVLDPADDTSVVTTATLAVQAGSAEDTTFRVIGGTSGSLFVQLSAQTASYDVRSIDPLPRGVGFVLCSATPGEELRPFYQPSQTASSPWVLRTNPVTGSPFCGYCMPDQQIPNATAFWWYVNPTAVDALFDWDGSKCSQRIGFDPSVWDTDDCDLPPGATDTSHCERTSTPELQSTLCSLEGNDDHMCRPRVTPCSVGALYSSYRAAVLNAVTQSFPIPSTASQGLASYLPNFWNDKRPNMWIVAKPNGAASSNMYTGSVRYQGNGVSSTSPTRTAKYRLSYVIGQGATTVSSGAPQIGIQTLQFKEICYLVKPPPGITYPAVAHGTATLAQTPNAPGQTARYTATVVIKDPITCTVVDGLTGNEQFVVSPGNSVTVNITCHRNTDKPTAPTSLQGKMIFYGEGIQQPVVGTLCSCCQVTVNYDPLVSCVGSSPSCSDPTITSTPSVTPTPTPSTSVTPTATPKPATPTPSYVPVEPAKPTQPPSSDPSNSTSSDDDTVTNDGNDASGQAATIGYIILGIIGVMIVLVGAALAIYFGVKSKKDKEE